jgi:hypothetical protein
MHRVRGEVKNGSTGAGPSVCPVYPSGARRLLCFTLPQICITQYLEPSAKHNNRRERFIVIPLAQDRKSKSLVVRSGTERTLSYGACLLQY